MSFKVFIESYRPIELGDGRALRVHLTREIELPFVPMIGMVLELADKTVMDEGSDDAGLASLTVMHLYWVHHRKRFEIDDDEDLHSVTVFDNEQEMRQDFEHFGWKIANTWETGHG